MSSHEQAKYPIVCHVDLRDRQCPGCIVVRVYGKEAELVCNECGQVFGAVPPAKVEEAIAALGKAAGA